jgi:hypothetical protein
MMDLQNEAVISGSDRVKVYKALEKTQTIGHARKLRALGHPEAKSLPLLLLISRS